MSINDVLYTRFSGIKNEINGFINTLKKSGNR